MADELHPVPGALRSEEAFATEEDMAGVQERIADAKAEQDESGEDESAAKAPDEAEAAKINEEMQSAAPKATKSAKKSA